MRTDRRQIVNNLFLKYSNLAHFNAFALYRLIFSQSLYSLNVIEYFLNKIDEATQNKTSENLDGYVGSWSAGLDYFRLDGSTSCDNRALWCKLFNDPNNMRAR